MVARASVSRSIYYNVLLIVNLLYLLHSQLVDPGANKMKSERLNQLDGVTTKIESLLPSMSIRDIKESSSLCGKAKETFTNLYVSRHSFVRGV